MAEEEARIRKAHKNGSASDKLVNAARLAVLERNIKVAVKRHRNPDQVGTVEGSQPDQISEDETVVIAKES